VADWKTPKEKEGCATCERPFEEGEAHFSILRLDPEALGREDRCPPCFEAGEGLPEELVFWRTRRRPSKKRGLALDFESVERLFLALEGRAEERLIELRYLLSLLLMRKKRVKLVRVKRSEEGEWMVLRRPRRDEALEVRVFDLTPDRARELRGELEKIFEGADAEDLLVPTADGSETEVPGVVPEASADSE